MRQACCLGELGRAERRLEHGLDHHVARVERLRRPGVRVHQLGEELLVERAPVHPDPDRLVVVDRDADDRREVLVVPLRANVPGVDPVLRQRGGHLRVLDQELVPVVVEVADDRHVHAETTHLAHHLGDRGGGLVGVHRDSDQLRAGMGQSRDLDRRRVGVGRVRVGHRLDDDRMRAPDEHAADVHADGGSPAGTPGQICRNLGGGVGNGRKTGLTRQVDRVGPFLGHAPPPSWRRMSKPVIQIRNAKRNTKPTA
jgi:hypothetical protein